MAENRKNKIRWVSYDIGNSAYALIYISFFFPLLIKSSFQDKGSLIWGSITSASALIGILLALYLGRSFDRGGRWRIFPLALTCSLLSLASFVILPIYPYVAAVIFALGNACYIASIPRYDSLLMTLGKTEDERVTLSAWGWGVGYLGGIAVLLIGLAFSGSFPREYNDHYFYFIPCCLIFIFFSIPVRKIEDLYVPGPEKKDNAFRKTPSLWYNMAALFLANEGMSAIMRFCAIFVIVEMKMTMASIAMLMLGAQLLAVPFTGLMGHLARKIGTHMTIILSLLIWVIISAAFYTAQTLNHLIVITILLSLVIGSTKSLLRGHLAGLVPPDKTGFFYSIYGLVTKSGSLLGPLLFGLVATVVSLRTAFLTLIPFFLLAIWAVYRMKRAETDEREAAEMSTGVERCYSSE